MGQLVIEELKGDKTAWIYPLADGEFEPVEADLDPQRVAFKVRHLSTGDRERMLQKMIQRGIMKRKTRGGQEQIVTVLEKTYERNKLFAESLVTDWHGVIEGGQSIPFSLDQMAQILDVRPDIYSALWSAVGAVDLFFGKNGNAP